jgi:hypothetical protein
MVGVAGYEFGGGWESVDEISLWNGLSEPDIISGPLHSSRQKPKHSGINICDFVIIYLTRWARSILMKREAGKLLRHRAKFNKSNQSLYPNSFTAYFQHFSNASLTRYLSSRLHPVFFVQPSFYYPYYLSRENEAPEPIA